eukprot:m.260170 g.260170  ORF g.260170 m.260170 type:complete len:1320 (+) comp26777_c0_seq19:76-4035(+)
MSDGQPPQVSTLGQKSGPRSSLSSQPSKRAKTQEDVKDEAKENGSIYYEFTPKECIQPSTRTPLQLDDGKSVADLVLAHDRVMEFYNRVKNHFHLPFNKDTDQVRVVVVAHRALTIPMWMEFIASLLPNRLEDVVCFIPKSSRDTHVERWLRKNLESALVEPPDEEKKDDKFIASVSEKFKSKPWESNDNKTRNLLLLDVGGKFTNANFLRVISQYVEGKNVRVSIAELTENGYRRYDELLNSDVLTHFYIQSVKLIERLLRSPFDVDLFTQHQELNMELQQSFRSQRQSLRTQERQLLNALAKKLQKYQQAVTHLQQLSATLNQHTEDVSDDTKNIQELGPALRFLLENAEKKTSLHLKKVTLTEDLDRETLRSEYKTFSQELRKSCQKEQNLLTDETQQLRRLQNLQLDVYQHERLYSALQEYESKPSATKNKMQEYLTEFLQYLPQNSNLFQSANSVFEEKLCVKLCKDLRENCQQELQTLRKEFQKQATKHKAGRAAQEEKEILDKLQECWEALDQLPLSSDLAEQQGLVADLATTFVGVNADFHLKMREALHFLSEHFDAGKLQTQAVNLIEQLDTGSFNLDMFKQYQMLSQQLNSMFEEKQQSLQDITQKLTKEEFAWHQSQVEKLRQRFAGDSDFTKSLTELKNLQSQQISPSYHWLRLCSQAQSLSLKSIARQNIKETEDYNVGRAIAEALDVELRLRKQTYLGNNLTIVVIGFGKIGAAAAETAAAKTHLPVIVVEWNPVRALKAAALSFPVMTLEEALPKAHAIISCTGAQVLRKEHQELLRDQVYIAACTSLEDEIHDSFFEYDTAESIASQAPQDPTDNLTTRDYATKTFNVVNKTINFIYGGVDGSYIHSVLASLVLCAVKGVQTPKPLGLEIPELKYDDAKNMAFFLTQSCVDSRPILSPNIEPDFIRQASEFSFDGDPSDTKRLVEFSKDYDLQAAVCEVWSDHPGAGKSFLARQFAQRSRRYQVVWMFDLDLPGPPQSTKFIKAINARFYNDPKHKDLRFKWQKPHEPDTDHRKQGLVDYLLTNASLHNLSMLIVLDHCRGEDVISIQKYTKQLQEENLVTRSLHFVVLHCGDPPKEILTQPKLVSSLSLSTYQRLVDFYCLMSMSKEQNGRQKKWQDWLDAHKTRLPVFSNFAVSVGLSCRFSDLNTGIPSKEASLDAHLLHLLKIIANITDDADEPMDRAKMMFTPSNGLPDPKKFYLLLSKFFFNRRDLNRRSLLKLEAEEIIPACQVFPELVRIHDDRIACCVLKSVLQKFIEAGEKFHGEPSAATTNTPAATFEVSTGKLTGLPPSLSVPLLGSVKQK